MGQALPSTPISKASWVTLGIVSSLQPAVSKIPPGAPGFAGNTLRGTLGLRGGLALGASLTSTQGNHLLRATNPNTNQVRLFWFSCSVVSDSLQPHELHHARLPCPSPSPGVCSNLCPLSQWCHPTISFSIAPFSSCPQSFQASRCFPKSWLFESDGQSIRVSASILPMNIQDWFPLVLTGFDLLAVHGTLKSLLQHHSSKASIL